MGHIAVVVTDLAMPGMDGLMLVGTLRRIEPGLKVIVSTGRTDDSHAAEITTLGVDGCLTKPYTSRNLLLKLSHVLQSSGKGAAGLGSNNQLSMTTHMRLRGSKQRRAQRLTF
jgi:DNA-binding response OmpR family regulator